MYGREPKNITISLRLNTREQEKLNNLLKVGNEVIADRVQFCWERKECTNSKMIRCLIEAFSQMPEEQQKELIDKYYRIWL